MKNETETAHKYRTAYGVLTAALKNLGVGHSTRATVAWVPSLRSAASRLGIRIKIERYDEQTITITRLPNRRKK